MRTKHFTIDGKNAVCGLGKRGTGLSLTHSTSFVECSKCQTSKAYQAKIQADFEQPVAVVTPARVTLADESLKTPRDAAAAAKQLSDACFNDEIRAIVARELLRYIVRPHDGAVAVQLERAQDASSSLVNAFDRQYHD